MILMSLLNKLNNKNIKRCICMREKLIKDNKSNIDAMEEFSDSRCDERS